MLHVHACCRMGLSLLARGMRRSSWGIWIDGCSCTILIYSSGPFSVIFRGYTYGEMLYEINDAC